MINILRFLSVSNLPSKPMRIITTTIYYYPSVAMSVDISSYFTSKPFIPSLAVGYWIVSFQKPFN